MAMRRLTTICLLALSAVALLVAAPVASAAKKGPKPQITRVTPMRISVGNLLTIRGRHFKAKAKANTIIFRSNNGRTAFAKPRRASSTKLVVRVPAAVARLLSIKNSQQRPTRLKLRVLAGKFSNYTSRRLSPVVTGGGDGDGGNDGKPPKVCKDDSDHDNDLLSNDLELQIGTDPCLEDTDGDHMTDGWEYYSAKDLNIKAVPYPGKRPFPNALDPSDGSAGPFSSIDFDGDGLTSREEYRAWRITGSSFIPSKADGLDLQSPLGYSDGTKYSRSDEAPGVPAWRGPGYGLPAPTGFPAIYNFRTADDGMGVWRDDERDADGDGLANWLESARGPGVNSWWSGFWAQEERQVQPWPKELDPASADPLCGQEPGHFDERPFAELDLADSDVDGDTLLDGEDDQDNDDYTNIAELYEIFYVDAEDLNICGKAWLPTIGSYAVNPFNPCAPNEGSRTCDDYKPFG
jgi:hypothetical protein